MTHNADFDAPLLSRELLTEKERELRDFLVEQGRTDLWMVAKSGFRRSYRLGVESVTPPGLTD